MILKIADWEFDIDMERTMEYSAAEAAEHCDCAYCRNFYAAIDGTFPGLRPFLAQFGIDIEAPDELMPFMATHMCVLYAVSGTILHEGKAPIFLDGLRVDPEDIMVSMINTACPRPLFILNVGPFDVPWVLDEPCDEEEIVSPANEPSFLKKMWEKLIGKTKSSKIKS